MRITTLSVLLLFGCGATEAPPLDPASLALPGPYAVGYRLDEVSYQAPLQAEPRRMRVSVWYPAEPGEGEHPFYVAKVSEVAITDAVPKALGPRPVVVFSHGHQAYAAVMSHLMEHLASHGYIAIAPTHTGNTFIDGDNRETDIYFLRAFDIEATLDHYQGLTNDPLAGMLSDRIAIMGHSFGGYTAFGLAGASYPVEHLDAECAAGRASPGYCSTLTDEKRALFRTGFLDSRFSAMVSLDPGDFDLFGAEGVAKVGIPVLHFVAEGSGNPPGTPSADRYWSALHGPDDLRLLLLGGEHNDFTDSCSAGVTLRCSTLVPSEVFRPMRIYTLGFLQRSLEGIEGREALLDGQSPVSAPGYEVSPR